MTDVWNEIEQEMDGNTPETPTQSIQKQAQKQSKTGFMDQIPDFLTYETGSRKLEYYKEHAINFNGSEWFGRILRGIDGLTQGKLKNFWYFDVGIGIHQAMQGGEQKQTTQEEVQQDEVEEPTP